jgi:LmbE family N-acetylglucosaminyl deacetylase
MSDEYLPQKVMSIHAHPDDQEFTVAGTLAKWSRAGCNMISVVITSGDAGSNDPAHDAAYKPELASAKGNRMRRMKSSASNRPFTCIIPTASWSRRLPCARN